MEGPAQAHVRPPRARHQRRVALRLAPGAVTRFPWRGTTARRDGTGRVCSRRTARTAPTTRSTLCRSPLQGPRRSRRRPHWRQRAQSFGRDSQSGCRRVELVVVGRATLRREPNASRSEPFKAEGTVKRTMRVLLACGISLVAPPAALSGPEQFVLARGAYGAGPGLFDRPVAVVWTRPVKSAPALARTGVRLPAYAGSTSKVGRVEGPLPPIFARVVCHARLAGSFTCGPDLSARSGQAVRLLL